MDNPNNNIAAHIKLRLADEDDCHDLWAWRNHPDVRKWCFVTKEIEYSSHRQWFHQKLGDTDVAIYIAEDQEKGKIGQVRFEKDAQQAYISICLNPEHIGKGFGSKIIKESSSHFMQNNPSVQEIIAEIIQTNEISKKAFQKAGYLFSHSANKQGMPMDVFVFKGSRQ